MQTDAGNAWDFSDAWFLTSVAIGGPDPQGLERVMGTADGLNHAILTHAEIQQAVRRLLGAGLLALERDGRFGLTASGRALMERRTGSHFKQTRSVLELLDTVPMSESEWTIDPAEVHQAHKRYRRSTGY